MEWYAAYLLLGAFVGFFAGLLGIGGGLVLVPVLSWLFEAQHLGGEQGMHLALGTSMAAILYTAATSAYTHHAHGAVNMAVVRGMTPGLLLGTLLGALFASAVSQSWLSLFFALFVYFAAVQMLLDLRPKAARQLPERTGLTLAGSFIGAISSLVSIGGGTLSVPYMLWHNIPFKQAIGTSAALGFPIALGGTTGYVATGLMLHTLPVGTLGFVYLPALFMLIFGSAFTTPLGARATHRLPLQPLRRGFAVLLLVLATRMLLKAFT
ncbi:sulfite exporter TauE/SafE family protein [Candidatus Ferrigenium straubiae]|uniref:sulfite exporter TauE/SafE family protein n=1 Tax=Candidatus Ferrigenium straubiae TaxID=2919506 RepID=UPI003F4AB2CF